MNSNKPQILQFKRDYMCSFSIVESKKATKAAKFYEYHVNFLPYWQTSEKDNWFDWDKCRAYCSIGKLYSSSRFMDYVALWFETTVREIKIEFAIVLKKENKL